MHICQQQTHLSYAYRSDMIAGMQKDQSASVIKRLMQARGIKQKELSELTGVAQSSLSRIISGQIETPRDRPIHAIAEFFGVTTDQIRGRKPVSDHTIKHLMGLRDETPSQFEYQKETLQSETDGNVEPGPVMRGTAPLISWVQAGAWCEVGNVALDLSETEQYPCPPNCSERTFLLRVQGESMIDEYRPGSLIYVDPEVKPKSGDDVVVQCDRHGISEATFKRYIYEPGSGPILKALNPAWPERYMELDDDCRIIGVVVWQMISRAH